MINKRFLQISAVAMAVLVLISTLSVSIEKHYCGEHLVDVAIFTDAEKCGMEASDQDMDTSDEGISLMAKSCCKDVVDLHEGQDELSVEKTTELDSQQKVFVLSFAYVFSGLNALETENSQPFDHYSPPIVVDDIQVLHEVFLI